jgi:xanthine dehydrogenase iron-sulfur cluster and FAD-binding subunit A
MNTNFRGSMWDKYYSVTSLNEALEILDQNKEKARIIAGGTDLVLEIKQGIRSGQLSLIDISRIPELTKITIDPEGFIHIGPGVTHNHCLASEVIRKYAFPLAQACYGVGTPQIRNVATIAGNLVTASPANDTIAPLIAMDAEVVLASKEKSRTIKLNEFYTGVRSTILEPGEMIVDIKFRKLEEQQKGVFKRYILRETHSISVVNTSIIITFKGSFIKSASLSLGCVATKVFRVRDVENFLVGKEFNEENIKMAAEIAQKAAKPINDIRASEKYRLRLVKLLVADGLTEIYRGEEQKSFPASPVLLWGKNQYSPKKLDKQEIHTSETHILTKINNHELTITKNQKGLLIDIIRESAGLTGTKLGCGEGECGACTILMDGISVLSCLIPAPRAQNAEIITIEGVSTPEKLHPVQQAYIDEGAVQCGYCTPGFIMSSIQLLDEIPSPTVYQIKEGLSGNLCRCTGYYRIIAAVEKAAKMINQ